MNEADLQRAVIDLAKLRRWRVAHFRPARTEKGWRTPMTGHVGFPDLVLARDGKVIFAELKSDTGKFRPGQLEWAAAIGGDYRVWRPEYLTQIARQLR